METHLFDYHLPEDRIALRPPRERDGGRLLVCGDTAGHRKVSDWPGLVPSGALVVLNDTRVIPARLLGTRRETGGRVEIFLLERERSDPTAGHQTWRALGRASQPLRVDTVVDVDELRVRVVDRLESGTLRVELSARDGVDAAIERCGHVPIPPYLRRQDAPEDRQRYQTVYARHEGSVAAPTAGLHLTASALAQLEARQVEIGQLTLHVGVGTFRPVTAPDLDDHPMHEEQYCIRERLAEAVARARAREAPIIAVGTTVVRALESAALTNPGGRVDAQVARTRLLIQPGFRFRVVDGLLTNFHMPQSTLLALVAAFAGRSRVMAAYELAVREGYRFLSYGDAMWLPTRAVRG